MTDTAKRDLVLWTGLLTPPTVWFASLEAKFALAPWVCAFQWKPAVYLVAAVALLITAATGFLSWTQWRQTPPAESRARAMAFGGVLLSAGMIVVLIAQSLPELILAGCE